MEKQISPNEGQMVITSDGEELGRVKEVTATSFKVDVPLGRDFWLANSTVEMEQGGVLRLNLARSIVEHAKLDAPAEGAL